MSSNYQWGQMASSVAPALTTLLAGASSVYDIKARAAAVSDTMSLSIDSFSQQEDIISQQSDEIDRNLGDSMSQRGLDAMKAEAMLRAASAETGTSGGTTVDAIKNSYMNQALDNSVLISRSRSQKVDLERRSIMQRISLRNRLSELKGSLATSTGAALQTASSSLGGFSTGYSMLPSYRRDAYFDF